MDTNTQTMQPNTDIDTQADIEHLDAIDKQIDVLVEAVKVQELAQQIEANGTPEMKAKLKPFKEHYNGDVVTLIEKRTKQNFDNDVWQEVSKAGDEAKAKYRQNPEAYLSEDQRQEYWESAYNKTVDEARKLAQNLEQVLQTASVQADQPPVDNSAQPATQRRRLFNRSSSN